MLLPCDFYGVNIINLSVKNMKHLQIIENSVYIVDLYTEYNTM